MLCVSVRFQKEGEMIKRDHWCVSGTGLGASPRLSSSWWPSAEAVAAPLDLLSLFTKLHCPFCTPEANDFFSSFILCKLRLWQRRATYISLRLLVMVGLFLDLTLLKHLSLQVSWTFDSRPVFLYLFLDFISIPLHAGVNCGPVASWWSFTNIMRRGRVCLCTSGFTQAEWKWLASVTSPKLLLFVAMEYSRSVMWACHEYSADGVLVWLIHYRLWQPHPSGRATLWPSFGKPLERTHRLAVWDIM